MQHTIVLPDLGQTTSEARILQWLKRTGEPVRRGEPLLTVETDKVNMDVESYENGYLRCLLVPEGEMASALAPVAILTDAVDEPYTLPEGCEHSAAKGAQESEAAAQVATARSQTANPVAAIQRSPHLSNERRLELMRSMLLCRHFEDRVYYLFLQGRMPGTIHQAQGQEASAVGVCSALRPGDVITSTHRPHEHAVARGVPVNSLMAELFARTTGCCRGKGGSMHVGDLDYGMMPAIAIVGGGIPLASGYALAMQQRKTGNIVACFFGDGATNIGSFHEGVNIAAVWDLPVVFVCENNRYGASTAIEKVTRVPRLSKRAAAYGIPGKTVDGNDVEAVHDAMLRAAERARSGRGPTLLEIETYRFAGHSRSDPGHYRSKEEVEEWRRRDPLVRYEAFCIAEGLITPDAVEAMKQDVERELDQAVQFAEASPMPAPEDCLNDVFAS